MSHLLERFIKYFLPTNCILCGQSQAEPICKDCLQELAIFKTPHCRICATPSHQGVCRHCLIKRPAFDASYSVSYIPSRLELPLKKLREHSSPQMINGIVQAWEIMSSKNCTPVDLLIPRPLSEKTLSKRGFNQSWEICKQMGISRKIPATANLLKKYSSVDQAPQLQKLQNHLIKESFYLNSNELIKINGLEGKSVGVVDDFMDSVTTLDAIAKLLKENGASWVSNWVILRNPSPELY